MSKATKAEAEKAAEILGVDVFDLGLELREAAAKVLDRAADRVRRGHPLDDVSRARNLLAAAEACEKSMLTKMDAEESGDEG